MTEAPSAGWLEGREHLLPVRIYYEDTDFTGVVYHANYLRYFERGRSDFLRMVGVGHAELADHDSPTAVIGDGGGCNLTRADRGEHPINCVTFAQAESYCGWVGKRLPDDDEWIGAARGPLPGDPYPWGRAPIDATRACWDRATVGTCPVGSTPAEFSAAQPWARTAPRAPAPAPSSRRWARRCCARRTRRAPSRPTGRRSPSSAA